VTNRIADAVRELRDGIGFVGGVHIARTLGAEKIAARLMARPMSSKRRFNSEYVKPIGTMKLTISSMAI
jgi:hypothetical protein